MAQIEGIKIENFRVLRDVTLGRLGWSGTGSSGPLTPMTAVIGKNGVGKSSLFDAFGFLADCLQFGVEKACDSRGRGGYDRIRSQGVDEPIKFAIYYRQEPKSRPIKYELEIGKDTSERPYVAREKLSQAREHQSRGRLFLFLDMKGGDGVVWKGEALGQQEGENTDIHELSSRIDDKESTERESFNIPDMRTLSIASLGVLKQHPRIAAFRQFIEGWYLSYFTPDAARSLPLAGPQERLNIHGDNLGNVVQYMEREHKSKFEDILVNIAEKVPGIDRIDTEQTSDGRVLIRFNDRGFTDPFYAQQVSDGTLKLFAYLLMLEDPTPPPFICIEEPENGLYHQLLEILAEEFRHHAKQGKNKSQIFVTTHQPYFVNALKPDEVWIMEKEEDGFSTIRRASDDELVVDLVNEDLLLGSLWHAKYLERTS